MREVTYGHPDLQRLAQLTQDQHGLGTTCAPKARNARLDTPSRVWYTVSGQTVHHLRGSNRVRNIKQARNLARVLGRLAEIAVEIDELAAERDVLIRAAKQHGGQQSMIADASGVSRSTVARMRA